MVEYTVLRDWHQTFAWLPARCMNTGEIIWLKPYEKRYIAEEQTGMWSSTTFESRSCPATHRAPNGISGLLSNSKSELKKLFRQR